MLKKLCTLFRDKNFPRLGVVSFTCAVEYFFLLVRAGDYFLSESFKKRRKICFLHGYATRPPTKILSVTAETLLEEHSLWNVYDFLSKVCRHSDHFIIYAVSGDRNLTFVCLVFTSNLSSLTRLCA